MYITWSSSTAAIGKAKAKSKQRKSKQKVINFFMPHLLRIQHPHSERQKRWREIEL
jgi:hypothetical protein